MVFHWISSPSMTQFIHLEYRYYREILGKHIKWWCILMKKWIEDTLSIISNFPENSAEPDKELLWRSPPTRLTQAWPMYCVAVKHSPGKMSLSYTGILYFTMNLLPKKVSAKRFFKNIIIFCISEKGAYNESLFLKTNNSFLKCQSHSHLIFHKWWFSCYVFIEWSPPTCKFITTGIISYQVPIENISTLRHAKPICTVYKKDF